MKPMPPWTCTPMLATSLPVSVHHPLDDGREQFGARLRSGAFLGIAAVLGEIELRGGVECERARGLRLCLHPQQHPLHVRMVDDRHRTLHRRHRRLALYARAGPLRGALEGALADRIPLAPHRQARAVHHDEHVSEAAPRLPHEVGDGPVPFTEGEYAGGTRVDAELVFDRQAAHLVALPEGAIGADHELRHDEQRDALDAGGCAVEAAEHHMDGVRGEVVIAPGDEDLLAREAIVITLGRGPGAHLAKIRAGLGLGEHHGAGPLTAHHLRQVLLLLCRGAAQFQRVHRTVR
jgi:hypothetical protein